MSKYKRKIQTRVAKGSGRPGKPSSYYYYLGTTRANSGALAAVEGTRGTAAIRVHPTALVSDVVGEPPAAVGVDVLPDPRHAAVSGVPVSVAVGVGAQ